MGRKSQFKRDLHSVFLSSEVMEYLRLRKASSNEPFYRVMDRIIYEYRLKDISEMSIMLDNLRKVNEIYLTRIHDCEAKLASKNKKLEDYIK